MLRGCPLRSFPLACWCFNGHPPLGVNATRNASRHLLSLGSGRFQWAPTLGGECYYLRRNYSLIMMHLVRFNGHPPLGVNATCVQTRAPWSWNATQFQWAPTLGGECYRTARNSMSCTSRYAFQWAPTLGGECYRMCSSLHHADRSSQVSMSTHPWG